MFVKQPEIMEIYLHNFDTKTLTLKIENYVKSR